MEQSKSTYVWIFSKSVVALNSFQDLIPVNRNRVDLYKFVFPPDLARPSLAVIGLIQPYGSIQPISELQARWAARVFAGRSALPTEVRMRQHIHETSVKNRRRYIDTQRHTLQVDYVPYSDDIAAEIGAKPSILKLFFTDPPLFFAYFFGPCTPFTFRLQGPGAWSGARDAVLNTTDRVLAPLKNSATVPSVKQSRCKLYLIRGTLISCMCVLFVRLGVAWGIPCIWASSFVGLMALYLMVFDIYFDLSTLFWSDPRLGCFLFMRTFACMS